MRERRPEIAIDRRMMPAALGSVTFHTHRDYLMHDVGTGDGIFQAIPEHYGRTVSYGVRLLFKAELRRKPKQHTHRPLWGVRLWPQLMHDGESRMLRDAIHRHGGEATHGVLKLKKEDAVASIEFLRSLQNSSALRYSTNHGQVTLALCRSADRDLEVSSA